MTSYFNCYTFALIFRLSDFIYTLSTLYCSCTQTNSIAYNPCCLSLLQIFIAIPGKPGVAIGICVSQGYIGQRRPAVHNTHVIYPIFHIYLYLSWSPVSF